MKLVNKWHAADHDFGSGKVHSVDHESPTKTLCGRLLSELKGEPAGFDDKITCKTCALTPERRKEKRERHEKLAREAQERRDLELMRRDEEKRLFDEWYSDYLKSGAWRDKRSAVIERSGGMCEGCGINKATQVHHVTYEHVGRELLWELRAVCDGCHGVAHEESRREPWNEIHADAAQDTTHAPAITTAPSSSALKQIRDDIGDCRRCKLQSTRSRIVFGAGNPKARVVFVGESPGAEDDLNGAPFLGRAGVLLTQIISAMGLKREDVYVTNIVKCRAPCNRQPESDEIDACSPFWAREIRVIGPGAIVALGKAASRALTGVAGPMSEVRGQWRSFDGIPVMPTFHPNMLLRDPSCKKLLWDDVTKVMDLLGLSRCGAP